MKNKTLIIFTIILHIAFKVHSQSVVGFWNVTQVTVGDEMMTPVSKWFKFTKDGVTTGGNGWTQNSYGTWSYNKKNKEFSATNELGIKDEFGPFKVSFNVDTMEWVRQEEGMEVVVKLVHQKEWMPAPIDMVKGLWKLIKTTNSNDIEITNYDPKERQYLWIRPDMRFQIRNPDESLTRGFWHMHGHRPILTLINYDRSIENQEYTISFDENNMIVKSRIESGNIFHYSRIDELPD